VTRQRGRNSTYPLVDQITTAQTGERLEVILRRGRDAPDGSLHQTSLDLWDTFKVKVDPSTISRWLKALDDAEADKGDGGAAA
jgi:hypothetical protein